MRGKQGRQTEESVSDVIIPRCRERVKSQHTACFTPHRDLVCVCLCVYLEQCAAMCV